MCNVLDFPKNSPTKSTKKEVKNLQVFISINGTIWLYNLHWGARPIDKKEQLIDHFTVLCSMNWPFNGSKAGGEMFWIQTSLLLLCNSSCSNANYVGAFTWWKEIGLHQNKVTSTFTASLRPGHWADNCKMVHRWNFSTCHPYSPPSRRYHCSACTLCLEKKKIGNHSLTYHLL